MSKELNTKVVETGVGISPVSQPANQPTTTTPFKDAASQSPVRGPQAAVGKTVDLVISKGYESTILYGKTHHAVHFVNLDEPPRDKAAINPEQDYTQLSFKTARTTLWMQTEDLLPLLSSPAPVIISTTLSKYAHGYVSSSTHDYILQDVTEHHDVDAGLQAKIQSHQTELKHSKVTDASLAGIKPTPN